MNLTIKENGIIVNGKFCWMCKGTNEITNHHTLPQYLKPLMNVELPLCRDCHDKLHGQDMNVLSSFAFKIKKTLQEGINKIGALKSLLERKKKVENEVNVGQFIKMNKK